MVSRQFQVIHLVSLTCRITGKSAVSRTNRIATKLHHFKLLNLCPNRLKFRTFTLSKDFIFKASFKPYTFQVEFHDEDWLCPHAFTIQPANVELSTQLFLAINFSIATVVRKCCFGYP